MSGVKSNRLMFKGDDPSKVKKKRSKKRAHDELESGSSSSKRKHIDPDSWVPPPTPLAASGPLFIYFPSANSTSTPHALAIHSLGQLGLPHSHRIVPSPLHSSSSRSLLPDGQTSTDTAKALALLKDEGEEDAPEVVDLASGSEGEEPREVTQVWVCTRIIDDHLGRITLRSAAGRYLSSSPLGEVTAEAEARGEQESWQLFALDSSDRPFAQFPDAKGRRRTKEEEEEAKRWEDTDWIRAWAIRGWAGKWLSLDEVAGGKMEVRADGENVGRGEKLQVRMQGRVLLDGGIGLGKKAKGEEGKKRKVGIGKLEEENIMKYQARGGGRLVGSTENKSELRKARDEGRLAEEMLDRRSKLKSDKFAK